MTATERLSTALADRYRIEREIGAGGMATVFLAEDVRHRRKVAIKVLRPELAATMGPDRFLREIEIAAQLQHPHILPLLDSGDADGFLFYVMPYVQGESLRDRLAREHELPVHDALRIVTEIADALAHAHAHGVVHRDIKPDNILLSGRHALVADFGVAKAVSEASGRLTLTSVGVALGTPTYMAPEQASADPALDHRVDIYALGILAYELLAGRPPFTGRTAQEVLAAHMTRAPEPIRTFRGSVSPALEATVLRCLEKHPADRWQTTSDLLAQLEPLATSSGGMIPASAVPAPDRRPARAAGRIPSWAAWLAGGALVAAGAFALSLGQRGGPAFVVGRRTAVATGAEVEAWPSFVPDGRTVVFNRVNGARMQLYVQQVDGGGPIALDTRVSGSQCCAAISPDGSQLLFLGEQGLYVGPVLGGQARRVVAGAGLARDLTITTTLTWGAWSPDGRRIAYPNLDTLVVQELDGSGRTAIAAGGSIHSPAWSGDGKWIAFVRGNWQFHLTGNVAPSTILVVPAAGGEAVAVTDSAALHTSPVFVPGGSSLLFISDRDGGRDVYELALARSGHARGEPVRVTTGLSPNRIALSADGTRLAWSVSSESSNIWSVPIPDRDSISLAEATPITSGTQTIETLGASPDGAWLYYDSDARGNADIWRIPVSGGRAVGQPEQVTTDSAGEFSPDVSPDGREIVFHSFRNGNRDIFVAPAAGGSEQRVTTSPQHDWNPHWLPDGKTILFDNQEDPVSPLRTVTRAGDGTWGPPRAHPYRGRASMVRPSPDGRLVAFTAAGTWVLDVAANAARAVAQTGGWLAWHPDGSGIYHVTSDSARSVLIRFVSIPGGERRTVVYAPPGDRRTYRYGLTATRDRFYVPLFESKADVWVAELARR